MSYDIPRYWHRSVTISERKRFLRSRTMLFANKLDDLEAAVFMCYHRRYMHELWPVTPDTNQVSTSQALRNLAERNGF